MDYSGLRKALEIKNRKVAISGSNLTPNIASLLSLCHGSQPIEIRDAEPGPDDGQDSTVVIRGKSDFLNVPDLPVEAKAFIDREGNAQLFLKYTLPSDWKFSRSFTNLPRVVDRRWESEEPTTIPLDDLNLSKAAFVLVSQPQQEQAFNVDLKTGINFVGQIKPDGIVGIIQSVFGIGKDVTLYGTIHIPELKDVPAPIERFKFPWDLPDPVPGILLQGDLGLTKPSPFDTIFFGDVVFRMYSPPDIKWLEDNPTYQPVLAYTGTLSLPKAGSKGIEAKVVMMMEVGTTELFLLGHFDGASVANLAGLDDLFPVAGTNNLLPELPAQIKDIVAKPTQIELIHLGIALDISGSKPEITWSSFTIGKPKLEWDVWPPHIKIESITCSFELASPFDNDKREIEVTVYGECSIEGAPVKVSARKGDEFTLYGELAGEARIPLQGLIDKYVPGVPLPRDLTVKALRVGLEPGSSFSFLAGLKTDWDIVNLEGRKFTLKEISVYLDRSLKDGGGTTGNIEGVVKIADVDITVRAEYQAGSDAGWQFEGSTGLGQKIPIGALINDLANIFNTDAILPAAIAELTIENLHVVFNTQTKDFTFAGEAKFPADGQEVEITVTIDIKHQQDGTYNKHFSGQITVDGLVFNLIFDTTPDSKVFIASYHDAAGRAVKIDDIIQKVFALQSATGLEFTLRDALFAYRGGEAHSKYLFGLDIEGGLNLSDLKLPNLPLVSHQPLPPDQTLKLTFQVLVANDTFTGTEVAALNALSKDGLTLPAKEIKGVDLAASLRLGQETMQLSLPIGLSKEPKEGESGLTETSQLPAEAAKADTSHTAAQTASADGTQWIKIQKSFGPVHFERVGLKYQPGQISGLLDGLLDAALTVAGLTIELDGLTVSSPLDHFQPTFDLHGLSVDYSNGPVEIGGAFLRMETGFAGLAVIRTEKLTLSAIGSYASLNGHPSLFIYAVLDYPLGGPSFFYVTGLAAGFGYNRALSMPTIDQVASFPLVEEVTGDRSPAPLPTDRKAQLDTLTNELKKLENYIPPSIGENFLAVGIRFTSFKMFDSFALLVVKFGQRFEIDLLGLSMLVAPTPVPGEKPVPPVAEAQIVLKATFIPDDGFLEVLGQLTPHSYVLSKACHLTGGGFAFYSWFKDQPNGAVAGDFVATMGGYHPQFHKPDYYPAVPRLSLTWQVNDHLSIKAQAYFALTGHALMAGGNLEVNYHSDDIKAWFKAGADFLISWKPYHYDARLYVNMRAEVTVTIFGTHHLSFDAGADLHLWGPEFAVHAHVYVKVLMFKVTFDVDFGAGASLPEPIDWNTFKASFLPHPEQVCGIALQQGLVRQIKDETGKERWIVNPKEFSLVTNSLIPSTRASFGKARKNGGEEIKLGNANTAMFINPMAVDSGFSSEQIITITNEYGQQQKEHFTLAPVLKAAPAGLWDKPITKTVSGKKYLDQPDVNGKRLIENTLAGFEIKPANPPQEPGTSPWINPKDLRYEAEPVPDAYEWKDFKLTDLQGKDAWQKVDTILDTPVKTARKGLLTAFGFGDEMVEFGHPVKQYVVD